MVICFFIQVLFLILDRTFYQYRSLAGKMALQITTSE